MLPAQPASGKSTYIPLGGNGFLAPHSAYYVSNFKVDGDASAGTATLSIYTDPRYACLCSLVQAEGLSAAADAEYHFSLWGKNDEITLTQVGTSPVIAFEGVWRRSWSPPPLMDFERVSVNLSNIDATEDYRLSAVIYNFDIAAPHKIPLPQLFASLPRSPSAL